MKLFIKILQKHFFNDVFQENSNPKTIWIQELTPESALDPGTDSWKPCRSRSWLLKTHVNLIQVEATCIRKNTKQYPKWKYCMAFSWLPMMLKIERVKSWTSTGFTGQEKNEKNEKVKLAWSQGFGRVRESGFKLDVICSSRRQFWKVM